MYIIRKIPLEKHDLKNVEIQVELSITCEKRADISWGNRQMENKFVWSVILHTWVNLWMHLIENWKLKISIDVSL